MHYHHSDASHLISPGAGTFPSDGSWTGAGAVVAVNNGVISDDSIVSEASGLFTLVVRIAIANMLFNALRPDPLVSWSLRLPRVLWELSIATVARGARQRPSSSSSRSRRGRSARSRSKNNKKFSQENVTATAYDDAAVPSPETDALSRTSSVLSMSPSRFLLLAFMLIMTALTDIFVWAPIFAAMINFKTCTGGWFTGEPHRCHADLAKGYGRAFVVAQCIVGGIIYLLTGISAWNVYATQQQRQAVARHVTALHHHQQQERWHHQQLAEKERIRWLVEEEQKKREEERLRREEEAKKGPDASSFWSAPSFWPGL